MKQGVHVPAARVTNWVLHVVRCSKYLGGNSLGYHQMTGGYERPDGVNPLLNWLHFPCLFDHAQVLVPCGLCGVGVPSVAAAPMALPTHAHPQDPWMSNASHDTSDCRLNEET